MSIKIKVNKIKKITIDKSPKVMYTKNTKQARPQTVVPQDLFEIAQTWQCGGYLAFITSVIKNTITKMIILVMYFIATTTSDPD